jgi:Cys-tRNA(Pro)/Cys-tRNA(Cys) deacylase
VASQERDRTDAGSDFVTIVPVEVVSMTEKTIAMRVLEGKKVAYEVIAYDDQMRDAVEVAQAIGAEPGGVFKTLVVTRPAGKPFLVMLPADKQLDLKKMAKAVGEKKVSMASHHQAEELTGLQVGGISALALLNRGFVICADASIRDHEMVLVSAGKKGLQLRLASADLLRVTRARVIAVSA